MASAEQGRVLVTGGTKGIGLAISRAFLEAGDTVLALYGHDDAAAAEAGRSLAAGDRFVTRRCDVRDPAALVSTIDEAWREGPLRALVNNAATMVRKPFLELTLEDWQSVIDTNLRGYFLAAQTVARHAIEAGRELRIVNVSSTGQRVAFANQLPYLASKGGIGMLTRGLAVELAPHGIAVNAVAPGTILTELNRTAMGNEEFRRSRESRIPIGRIGVPEEVAPAVVFLASPAAAFITGSTLFIDGGQTSW